jgi:diadenosine tetraphosphate (Ap4A) HIT family hydrolase
MAEYDPENIFAKIIDGKIPSFKVFETKGSLAFLDAFPMAEGHVLVIPKAKGSTDLLTMSPKAVQLYMTDVQKVAKAVKEAFGVPAVKIWSNAGKEAGQTVFHPHFHIAPRKADDGFSFTPAKEMITKEAAEPLVEKIKAALNPPTPLKKPKFGQVSKMNPSSKGLNLKLKLVGDVAATEGGKFFEALAGDSSGTVLLSLTEAQKAGLATGTTVIVQNAAVKMVKGHIRVAVDKWGKIETTTEELEGEVNKEKNMSETEYELVKN